MLLSTRKIALLSDLHVGSRYAVFPDTYVGKDDVRLGRSISDGQLQLLEYFEDFKTRCDRENVDTVFLVGDIMHGRNYADQNRDLVTPDLDEQVEAAYELLEDLCVDRRVGVWSGTKYHEALDTRIHSKLCDMLKSVASESRFFDKVANLRIVPTDHIANIHHGYSTAYIYKATQLEREARAILEASAMCKVPRIDIVIRGHWHSYLYVQVYGIHLIQLPCFCTFIPYKGSLRLYGKFQPDLGGVILTVTQDQVTPEYVEYPLVHIADQVQDG